MWTSSHSRESLFFHPLHIPLGRTWAIFCSVTQVCLSLCDPMDCSMLGFPDLHHLPELAQTHARWDMSYTALRISGQLIIFIVFCLTRLSLPGLLAKENRLFCVSFCLCLLIFLHCQIFSCESKIHGAKRKLRDLTIWLVPQVLRFLGSLPSSLYLLQISNSSFMCNVCNV